MKTKLKFQSMVPFLILLSTIVILPGCGGSSSDNESNNGTDFSTLVTDQFVTTANNTDPVVVEDLDLRFRDQGNPNTFDSLLQ